MADGTKIEWTDATWNPITGCSVVSPGCTNCYAMKLAGTRLKNHASREGLTRDTKAGPVWTGEVRFNPQWLDEPLRWKKPRMIFVCAHGDLFAEGVPDEWIDQVFAVMASAPRHTFQVLTKRPERMRQYLCELEREAPERLRHYVDVVMTPSRAARQALSRPMREPDPPTAELRALYDRALPHMQRNSFRPSENCKSRVDLAEYHWRSWPLNNVWLGVSVEDQKRADERIPILLDTPAAVRWISAEPLLGPLDLRAFLPGYIRGPKRVWDTFSWPQWVPEKVRQQIEDFWRTEYGRGPDAWLRSAIENGQPPMGTAGSYRRCTSKEELIEGRFIPAWNNIGRVVAEDGETHVVSHGVYRSHPDWLSWIVAGGESGPNARPMHPAWARSLRDQCAAAGVPFLFKQWGAWLGVSEVKGLPGGAGPGFGVFDICRYDMETETVCVGKKIAGRLLDRVEHNGFPEVRR